MEPDGSVSLGAIVKGARGQTVNGRPVTWRSADEDIAYVDAGGRIVAGDEGSTTITANVLGVTGKATIDVRGDVVQILIDEPATSIVEGDVTPLSATFVYSNGATRTAGPLVWSSSNPARLWLDGDGEATAIAAGEVDVVAEGRGRRGSHRINVGNGKVTSVVVRASDTSLSPGERAEVWADVTNHKGDRVSKDVTWSTSDAGVVAVTSTGRVTASAAGTATISASVGSVSGSLAFSVTEPSGGGSEATGPGQPGQVSDLTIVQVTENSVQLRFTEVDDGTGNPASYLMRYGLPGSFQWGTALDVTKGDCKRYIRGSSPGQTRTCWVQGLNPDTEYSFQVASVRGQEEQTEWGDLSPTIAAQTSSPSVHVDVLPSAFQIDVGDTKQLSAAIEDSYGNQIDGTVSWASTSSSVASVTSGGLVNGLLAGQSAIRATHQGVAGSADATILQPSSGGGTSPPPPPGSGALGPGPNSPGFSTVIADLDACSMSLPSGWSTGNGWANNVRSIGDAGSPSGCALETTWNVGHGSSFAGAAFLNNWGQRLSDVYLRVPMWLPSTWELHPAGPTKLFLFGGGCGTNASEFVLNLWRSDDMRFANQTGSGAVDAWQANNRLPLGQWWDIEIVAHAQSAPGAADGWARVYVNGTEVTNWSVNLTGPQVGYPPDPLWDWHGTETCGGFKGIQWGVHWGGSGANKTRVDTSRRGGLYVAGR